MHAAGPDLGCLFFRKRGHTGSYGYCVNKKKTLTQKNYESLKLRSREGLLNKNVGVLYRNKDTKTTQSKSGRIKESHLS
eukprot:scaffold199345_cov17-Tisochrysis_lutea.AAC.1